MRFSQRGSSTVEYGLIMALVALTGMCGACVVGQSLSDSLSDVGGKLFAAITGPVNPGKTAPMKTLLPRSQGSQDGLAGSEGQVVVGKLAQAMVGPILGLAQPDEDLVAMKMIAQESVMDDPVMGDDPVAIAMKEAVKENTSKCSDGMDNMTVMTEEGMQVYENTLALTTSYTQTLEVIAQSATDNAGNPVSEDFAKVLQTLAQRGYTLANAQAAVQNNSDSIGTLTTGGVFASVDNFYNYYMQKVAPILEQPQYSQLKAQLEYYSGTITKVAETHYLQANNTNAYFVQKLSKDYTIGGITTVDVTFADSASSTKQNSQNIQSTSEQL